jgi:nucleotide-binding universal stress UspA family protein
MATFILSTDYSDNAMEAARYALRMFGTAGNVFRLTHAYLSTDDGFSEWPTVGTELYATATQGLAEWGKRLAAWPEAQGAVLVQDVVYGALPGILNELARQHEAELVVMGTRGASGATVFGSSAAAMVKHSSVPVLVVPEHSAGRDLKRIVFADDGQGAEAGELRMLLDLAARNRAEVLLAHVLRDEEEAPRSTVVSAYSELLSGLAHRFVSTRGKDVAAALDLLAEQEQADMLAVLHRHAGFLDSIFHVSTAKRLALHSKLPLLVLQSEKD